MSTFLKDLLELPFLQNALLAGVLCSMATGVVGTYVVLRRITYIAAAISHCILGGLGAARYFSIVWGWTWLKPVHGAIFTALASALIIGLVSMRAKEREDTVISALWAVGMAIGILFIFKTPGYNEDLMSYLFGNILMVSQQDLYLIGVLDLFLISLSMVFYKQVLAVCFDEEFARTRGVWVEFYYLLILCLTALTVVLTVSVVGIIMVIALISLPVAISARFFDRVWKIMVCSIVLGMIFTSGGLALSYTPNLPSGAVTILLAGLTYILTILYFSFRRQK
ncbi:MAG: zinc transport system permease protein [Clostridiales bacterium]|nr:zinc transport system permease protein [Clostridiales bacterium]MDN5281628.1 zinc transport system permease protein [Candidatus Ozemobacter sp.]